ncbi:MAG TPA: hypothetical protein VJK51_00875 [Candidatus Nanoarchaeia archaeon]|nr:hypothetical protein [Candidatus Nanoarchaeia archaeon]
MTTKQLLLASEILSLQLKKELEKYIQRNTLALITDPQKRPWNGCCPFCLKAHLLKRAQTDLDKKTINQTIRGKPGHDGYYLDADDLLPVN